MIETSSTDKMEKAHQKEREMSMREKSRLPMEERASLPEVKELVESYIKAVLGLHNYRLRIETFYIGGKDNCEIVIFTDMGSQKPMMINYNKE